MSRRSVRLQERRLEAYARARGFTPAEFRLRWVASFAGWCVGARRLVPRWLVAWWVGRQLARGRRGH